MTAAAPRVASSPLRRSPWRQPLTRVGGGMVLLVILAALLAGVLAPYPPDRPLPHGLDAYGMPRPPGAGTLLGTDSLGRDVFSRLLYGARISLLVGLAAMLTSIGVGVAIGMAAGYFGGAVDTLLMRLTDVMLTFPSLLLAIAWVAVLGPSILNVLLVVGLVSWTGIARIVRAQVLSLKERDFVVAARALGASHARILFRTLLPNTLPTIGVLATLTTANTVLLDAGLSYLGLGVPPPTPSWGKMVYDAQAFFLSAPWMTIAPATAIVVAVVGFNLLGHGLREALDPHGGRRAR